MPITSIGAGLLAGILSTLSPCVFPLLPLVVGAATSAGRLGAFWLAAGVAIAFTLAGLFVATVGFAVGFGWRCSPQVLSYSVGCPRRCAAEHGDSDPT